MLHYRILSYGSDYDWGLLVGLISLRDENEIDRQFEKRLNSLEKEEPFADDMSARLMAEIDNSRRTGEYAVITPKGKGCITCLASSVKFGLMVLDSEKDGQPVITKAGAVNGRVLEWLSERGDHTLVLTDNECGSLREVLSLVGNGMADLEYQGQVYSAYSIRECMEVLAPLMENGA